MIVYLVGAGPGDSGLLTLRGKECLEQADFVLYDQLVSPRILEFAPARAEKLCVRDLADSHPDRWPHIHVKLIEEARKGKCVVRLKGGDPLIFGRGGEEAAALREAGIPFEIVPGVTAALAAGACLEIPLTHRSHAIAIAFITGHEHPGKPSSRIDWKAVAAFPGTLVIYMGFSRLSAIVAELIHHGKPADTPAVAISHASTGEQRSVTSTLTNLEAAVRVAGLTTPALVMVGPVVGLRPAESWFEAHPLLGKRILITRPLQQATEMARELERLGAIPLVLPAIAIRDPGDWAPVDAALDKLRQGGFDWLVFTSANGVEKFMERLFDRGLDLRALGSVKVAAIGSNTANSLCRWNLRPDMMPGGEMNSEALAAMLKTNVAGKRVLLVQAEGGREVIREELAAVGSVETVAAYRQSDAIDPSAVAFDALRRGDIDFVTLTSPNIARAFLAACDSTIAGRLERGEVRIATNGPRISTAVRDRGFPVAVESREPTMPALIAAIIDFYRTASTSRA
jgi:uroporphyrinogen III methyltransferase/synthase